MQYKSLLGRLAELEAAVRAVCVQPQHCQQFLRAGRIVAVRDGEVREGAFLSCADPHLIVYTNSLYQSTGSTLLPLNCSLCSPRTCFRPRHTQTDWGYGVVVSVMRRPGGGAGQPDTASYTCDTLLACDPASLAAGGAPSPAAKGEWREGGCGEGSVLLAVLMSWAHKLCCAVL